MSYFFSPSNPKKGKADKYNVSEEMLHHQECRACPLNHEEVRSPKMAPTGSDAPDVYILGEAPGENEDKKAEQFVGVSGRILRNAIAAVDVDVELRFNNCIRTRPPKNRDPDWIELECCRPSVERDIAATKPKAIFGFGNIPLKWALKNDGGMTKWRGRQVPVNIAGHLCWYFPMLHPAFVLRQRHVAKHGKSEYERIFERDIKKALKDISKLKPPKIDTVDDAYVGIKIYTCENKNDIKRVIHQLEKFSDSDEPVGVDIETVSKERTVARKVRPYGNGARIITAAVGTPDHTIAFPLSDRKIQGAFIEFLLNSKVKKVCHNLNFELEWFFHKYGSDISLNNTFEDTMAQAFVIDERPGVLSLDALVLLHFGLHLKALSNINVNSLDTESLDKVLLYNALDAKYTAKLFNTQGVIIKNDGLQHVYREQVRRIPTVVLTQQKGLFVDFDRVDELDQYFTSELAKITLALESMDEVKEFNETYHRFKPGSPRDVGMLLSKVMKYHEVKKGKSYSTDESVLEKIAHPITGMLLEYRHVAKCISTYIDPVKLGGKFIWPDSKLHPVLNTTKTATRRLSSDSPNEQNYPKRRFVEVRSEIVAPKRYYFLSCDYGQVEARVIAMASKDEFLVNSLWERYDIHTEWAEKIAYAYPKLIGGKKFINDKQVMKDLRQEAKNKMVFPSFYGAKAPSISDNLGIPIGITEKLLQQFWDTFPGVEAWQRDLRKFYNRNGYVELLTGYRRHAPLDGNKIINTPIQGTASDIVVDGMNRLSEKARETGNWTYQAIMNIHDDLSFLVPEDTFEDDAEYIIGEMLTCDFDFINVPLSVEAEVGFNWHEKDPIGDFFSDTW